MITNSRPFCTATSSFLRSIKKEWELIHRKRAQNKFHSQTIARFHVRYVTIARSRTRLPLIAYELVGDKHQAHTESIQKTITYLRVLSWRRLQGQRRRRISSCVHVSPRRNGENRGANVRKFCVHTCLEARRTEEEEVAGLATAQNHGEEGHAHIDAVLGLTEVCRARVVVELRANLVDAR